MAAQVGNLTIEKMQELLKDSGEVYQALGGPFEGSMTEHPVNGEEDALRQQVNEMRSNLDSMDRIDESVTGDELVEAASNTLLAHDLQIVFAYNQENGSETDPDLVNELEMGRVSSSLSADLYQNAKSRVDKQIQERGLEAKEGVDVSNTPEALADLVYYGPYLQANPNYELNDNNNLTGQGGVLHSPDLPGVVNSGQIDSVINEHYDATTPDENSQPDQQPQTGSGESGDASDSDDSTESSQQTAYGDEAQVVTDIIPNLVLGYRSYQRDPDNTEQIRSELEDVGITPDDGVIDETFLREELQNALETVGIDATADEAFINEFIDNAYELQSEYAPNYQDKSLEIFEEAAAQAMRETGNTSGDSADSAAAASSDEDTSPQQEQPSQGGDGESPETLDPITVEASEPASPEIITQAQSYLYALGYGDKLAFGPEGNKQYIDGVAGQKTMDALEAFIRDSESLNHEDFEGMAPGQIVRELRDELESAVESADREAVVERINELADGVNVTGAQHAMNAVLQDDGATLAREHDIGNDGQLVVDGVRGAETDAGLAAIRETVDAGPASLQDSAPPVEDYAPEDAVQAAQAKMQLLDVNSDGSIHDAAEQAADQFDLALTSPAGVEGAYNINELNSELDGVIEANSVQVANNIEDILNDPDATAADIEAVQTTLNAQGYDLAVDGVSGPDTEQAANTYIEQHTDAAQDQSQPDATQEAGPVNAVEPFNQQASMHMTGEAAQSAMESARNHFDLEENADLAGQLEQNGPLLTTIDAPGLSIGNTDNVPVLVREADDGGVDVIQLGPETDIPGNVTWDDAFVDRVKSAAEDEAILREQHPITNPTGPEYRDLDSIDQVNVNGVPVNVDVGMENGELQVQIKGIAQDDLSPNEELQTLEFGGDLVSRGEVQGELRDHLNEVAAKDGGASASPTHGYTDPGNDGVVSMAERNVIDGYVANMEKQPLPPSLREDFMQAEDPGAAMREFINNPDDPTLSHGFKMVAEGHLAGNETQIQQAMQREADNDPRHDQAGPDVGPAAM